MSRTRRRLITTVGLTSAGLAHAAGTACVPSSLGSGPPIATLAARSEQANDALMRGDMLRYRELVRLSDDFTLMSPFGGTPTHGRDLDPERMARMGRFFRNGSLTQELVQAYGTDDMVVLAVVERAHVEVGGLPAQDWSLRVTLVYRRDERDDEWTLVHRHADPLVGGIDLLRAAELARAAAPSREGR